MRVAVFVACVLWACVPDTTGGSSGLSSGGAGDGGDDSGVPSDRAALCNAYANSTAQCCQRTPGTCTSNNANDWKSVCLNYARTCPAMPTCFSGSDCNTLIYCSGAC
jgi:hypothetical protein